MENELMSDEEYRAKMSAPKSFDERMKDGSIYDKDFFDPKDCEVKTGYSIYQENNWMIQQSIRITDVFGSHKILDVGCAKGFFVKRFRDLGREAYGVDISEYAINSAPDDVRPFLSCMDVKDIKKEDFYNLIISIETLEHVYYLDDTLDVMYKCLTNPGFLWVSVPFYAKDWETGMEPSEQDLTHRNLMTKDEWIKKIESHGFVYLPDIKVGVGEAENGRVLYGVKQDNINELTFIKSESKWVGEE